MIMKGKSTFSNINGTSPSNCLMSYLGHSLGESYPSAEKPLVYSTAPSDRIQMLRIPVLLLTCSAGNLNTCIQLWLTESEQVTPMDSIHSSKFHVGSQVWQIPEEGQRTYRPKHCGNNNKGEDKSLKTLNHKNHHASFQKLRQLLLLLLLLLLLFVVYLCFTWLL